jgi:hypothetical protein
MKKILLTNLLALSMPVMAQHHNGMRHFDHHQQHRQSNWGWVTPVIIGGAVVNTSPRPAPVIVQQPEIVIIDGISYIRQYQIINGVTTEVLIRQ